MRLKVYGTCLTPLGTEFAGGRTSLQRAPDVGRPILGHNCPGSKTLTRYNSARSPFSRGGLLGSGKGSQVQVTKTCESRREVGRPFHIQGGVDIRHSGI